MTHTQISTTPTAAQPHFLASSGPDGGLYGGTQRDGGHHSGLGGGGGGVHAATAAAIASSNLS